MKKNRKLWILFPLLLVLTMIRSNAFAHVPDTRLPVDAMSSATKVVDETIVPAQPIEVKVVIPSFDVHVNHVLIDTKHSQYPVITYKAITYFPMTYDYLSGIGLNLNFSEINGLVINVNNTLGTFKQKFLGANNTLGSQQTAILAPFDIKVNNKIIYNTDETYPVLVYKSITYFPMTWRFAVTEFKWQTEWSAEKGFGIIVNK